MTNAAPGAIGSLIVFFDGYCNLCNFWVNLLLKLDRQQRLVFAALTSAAAGSFALEFSGFAGASDTVILVDNGRAYTKSTAILRILRHLGGPWPVLYALIVIPRPIRDCCYDLFAHNRYRWFGRRESCRIPTADERDRFRD